MQAKRVRGYASENAEKRVSETEGDAQGREKERGCTWGQDEGWLDGERKEGTRARAIQETLKE